MWALPLTGTWTSPFFLSVLHNSLLTIFIPVEGGVRSYCQTPATTLPPVKTTIWAVVYYFSDLLLARVSCKTMYACSLKYCKWKENMSYFIKWCIHSYFIKWCIHSSQSVFATYVQPTNLGICKICRSLDGRSIAIFFIFN